MHVVEQQGAAAEPGEQAGTAARAKHLGGQGVSGAIAIDARHRLAAAARPEVDQRCRLVLLQARLPEYEHRAPATRRPAFADVYVYRYPLWATASLMCYDFRCHTFAMHRSQTQRHAHSTSVYAYPYRLQQHLTARYALHVTSLPCTRLSQSSTLTPLAAVPHECTQLFCRYSWSTAGCGEQTVCSTALQSQGAEKTRAVHLPAPVYVGRRYVKHPCLYGNKSRRYSASQ